MRHNPDLPSDQPYSIFISYRRDDTSGHAGHLYSLLSNKFPGRVFMDIDKIEPGQDFVEAINDAIDKSKALIVLIGREWLSISSSPGQRRLDNPDDHVHAEIAAALKRDILVIPVLVEGVGMPRREELPPALEKLARLNAIELSDARWNHDVQRLVQVLEKVFPGSTPQNFNKRTVVTASVVASLIVLGVIVFLLTQSKPDDTDTANQAATDGKQTQTAGTPGEVSKPAASPDTSVSSEQPQPQALVNMSKAEAEFVFPVDTNRKWRWNLKESEPDRKEYDWQIEVMSDGKRYEIAVFNYKKAGASQKEEPFSIFLSAMSRDVAYYELKPDYDPKRKVRFQIKANVDTVARQDKFSIKIKGEAVKTVFSHKPEEVKFIRKVLNEGDEGMVRIDYKD